MTKGSCSLKGKRRVLFSVAKGFFTEGEKPTEKRRSLLLWGSKESPPFDFVKERRAHRRRIDDSSRFARPLSPTFHLRFRQSRLDRDDSSSFEGAKNPLLLTLSKRDEPIVEGSTIYLALSDPPFDWIKKRRAHRQHIKKKVSTFFAVESYSQSARPDSVCGGKSKLGRWRHST